MLRLAGPEDMDRVREILSEPSVAPRIGPIPASLDHCALFLWSGGLFGAEVRRDYSVSLHLAVLPAGRGRQAIHALNLLLEWFFTKTPCPRAFGWSDSDNRANLMFNRLMGFKPRSARKGKTLFVLRKDEWLERQARNGR